MKKLTILFIFLLSCRILLAPDRAICCIESIEPINYYDPLIRAVGIVESSLNPLAYNPDEEAVGFLQIRPIRLMDYNKRTGKNYTLDQMYDKKIAKSIFIYYTKGRSYEKVARSWNGSGSKTVEYWKRVKAQI